MPNHFWEYRPARNARLNPALYAVPGQPCFLTIRAWGRAAPFANRDLARLTIHCLLEQRMKSGCQVDVYCLMPDHLHVVVTPAREGSSSLNFIDRFKGWSSRELHRAGWREKVWQPRSYDHLVRQEEDLQVVAAYILGNPIRRGLASTIEEYRWSGIPEPIDFALPQHTEQGSLEL